MLSVTPAAFRAVMGRFPTGVSIMTSQVGGVPHGMTANALASVSLEPLLVLVCVERDTVMADYAQRAGAFALSFLAFDDQRWSNHFANPGRPLGEEQFVGVPVTEAVTGAPILREAIAWLDCRTWALHDGGDHVIVVGEVVALDLGDDSPPLLYHRGSYDAIASAVAADDGRP